MAKYERGSKAFINPYNFIGTGPVKTDQNREKQSLAEGLHTGYLDCRLYTRTPLCVPDTSHRTMDGAVKDHFVYPFIKRNGLPFIPGSSIRGVIRSAYEAINESCMATIEAKDGISTRIKHTDAYQPCILVRKRAEKGYHYKLFAADRYALVCNSKDHKGFHPKESVDHTKFQSGTEKGARYIVDSKGKKVFWGTKVTFTIGDQYKKRNFPVWKATVKTMDSGLREGEKEGVVYIGEPIDGKHAEGIFVKKDEITSFNQDQLDAAFTGMKETFIEYGDSAVNRNLGDGHLGYRSVRRAIEDETVTEMPIWRSKNGLYFSIASIGRKQYRKTMEVLAGKSCNDRTCCCKACAMFGLVSGKKGKKEKQAKGATGLVRFTDAIITDDKDSLTRFQTVTLQELGKPRPSYLPFYAKEGKPYDEKDGGIRGRKFYWHNPGAATDINTYRTTEKTNRNATHEILMPGAVFRFRIYYDNVTDRQLDELIHIVTLGGNDVQETHCHKIGHGKPLGLGSCKITVESQADRLWMKQGDHAYTVLVKKAEEIRIARPANTKALDELMIITDYDLMKNSSAPIMYPPEIDLDMKESKLKGIYDEQIKNGGTLKENVLARHQWFSKNSDTLPLVEKKADGILYGSRIAAFTQNQRGQYNDFEWPRKNVGHSFKGRDKKRG